MTKNTTKATAPVESAPVAVDAVTDPVQAVQEVTVAQQADKASTHTIRAMAAKGFWRAGRFWPPEETPVSRDDFTDEQWLALESEPVIAIKSAE